MDEKQKVPQVDKVRSGLIPREGPKWAEDGNDLLVYFALVSLFYRRISEGYLNRCQSSSLEQ